MDHEPVMAFHPHQTTEVLFMNKETIINTNLSLIQALLTSQGAEFLTEVEEDGRPF